MFSKKSATDDAKQTDARTADGGLAKNVNGMSMFGQGCVFEGTACLQGHSRVSGQVKGTILSSHILHVEETAQVQGTLHGYSIEISGQVEGEIHAKEVLRLTPRARVRGQIRAAKLIVEEGAFLQGQVETQLAPPATAQPKTNPTAAQAQARNEKQDPQKRSA